MADHGADLSSFMRELFASGVSSFFALDVVVAVVIVVIAASLDDRLSRKARAAVMLGSLLGASVGIPAYLLARERGGRTTQAANPIVTPRGH